MLRRLVINSSRRLAAYRQQSLFMSTSSSPELSTDKGGNELSAEQRISSLQDSYLRALADMENLRQRTKKEVEASSQFAIQKFAKDIIGVADVMEMALSQIGNRSLPRAEEEACIDREDDTPAIVENDGQSESLVEGLEMTLRELLKTLKNHGVTPIDPVHQRFDPNMHMALYEVPAEHLDAGIVVSVQKKGYLLNGRVIRAAQVAVSKKP